MQEYYIQLFSPHGLIRHHKPEIGRDKDTGGQVKYVLELLEALSHHPQVRKVDLFTRRIADKRVSETYSHEIETVSSKARIVRITCGGHLYKPKESLWDILDEFVDKVIRFIEKQDDYPDIVHGHYADGNYIAGEISKIFEVPFIATGHSLGWNKKSVLLKDGLSEGTINQKFNMIRRINEEEKTLKMANLIIVSTLHEIEAQYHAYQNKDRARFRVIPPGINTEIFYPFYRVGLPSFTMPLEQEQAMYRVSSEIERFLFAPGKPLILSIGRADKRKNFETIIDCFGQDKELQSMANLAIFAGVRKDITQMPQDEQEILTGLLLLMDKYDLYGKMALPKKNDPSLEVPEIYRLAAQRKGVFVNATPGENFGLTIVEAAACGLPIVASPTGGPKEIIGKAHNGMLVDVQHTKEVSDALKKIISDTTLWEKYSANGIRAGQEDYSWETHVKTYLRSIDEIYKPKTHLKETQELPFGKKLMKADLFFISDLDGTLIEGEDAAGLDQIKQWVDAHKNKVIFGIASGRNKTLTMEALRHFQFPEPDILICSAGTEIYYTRNFIPDPGWESHINHQWKRKELVTALEHYPGLHLQEADAQWEYKLSYYVNDYFNEGALADLYKFLDDRRLRAKILLTDNKFLDILPVRAGKGNAVRYLSYKWQLPLDHFITAGNGGNDIDMLRGRTKGIVVANYSPELDSLRRSRHVYFSGGRQAEGVMEGIRYYLDQQSAKAGKSDTDNHREGKRGQ
ncbi:HAD-IIB family hydrolase [Niabella aurantiaca]|uniref:HAD-IIB family hydrolase n=1 Tax=Niabella aurantiaca TaxID=379900 RepID=UPI00036ED143|nr:HAD-IIB family hydrolase [Niabella aurantiaca]